MGLLSLIAQVGFTQITKRYIFFFVKKNKKYLT